MITALNPNQSLFVQELYKETNEILSIVVSSIKTSSIKKGAEAPVRKFYNRY